MSTEPPKRNPKHSPSAIEKALAYHERTKHHAHRSAASLGYLDWASQPDPFRRYVGAELIRLPIPVADSTPPYERIYVPGAVTPRALDLDDLSEFLYCALAISAWKSHGSSTWALRVNPSSGNLHPTEGYAVLPALPGLGDDPAVYHYTPREHGLERRATIPREGWSDLAGPLPPRGFLVALTSIHWREAWKYGERAYRYCQHDLGHALAALRLSAAAMGWSLSTAGEFTDPDVSRLLGLDRGDEFHPDEFETPGPLAVVTTGSAPPVPQATPIDSRKLQTQPQFHGRANLLSPQHHPWPIIEEVSHACLASEHPVWSQTPTAAGNTTGSIVPASTFSAARIFRQRRSAVAMDGETGMTRGAFFSLLRRTIPNPAVPPWDAIEWPTSVHLGLFVHRVEGLTPGLYFLPRDPGRAEWLKGVLDSGFRWSAPEGSPPDLPLFLLAEGDARLPSTRVSCDQDIAGDGAFCVAMLAEFTPRLETYDAPFYRRLFWETGLIGQMLYLEAEAAGLRGTGIGCFFDDAAHHVFGIQDTRLQCLYHFTIGGPVEDPRLTTLPSYPPPV
ncbi:MAG: SagB family peptide dehydrogenase [Nitrospirae bacterium]|nr:SagB family peptide dehydrogenase [Nitrospirota bacterium]